MNIQPTDDAAGTSPSCRPPAARPFKGRQHNAGTMAAARQVKLPVCCRRAPYAPSRPGSAKQEPHHQEAHRSSQSANRQHIFHRPHIDGLTRFGGGFFYRGLVHAQTNLVRRKSSRTADLGTNFARAALVKKTRPDRCRGGSVCDGLALGGRSWEGETAEKLRGGRKVPALGELSQGLKSAALRL
jgi:hypothetical protein